MEPALGSRLLLGTLVLAAVLCASCDSCDGSKPTLPVSGASAAPSAQAPALVTPPSRAESRPRSLPVLKAASDSVSLAVSGFGAAEVRVPVGARSSRPVLIALHGSLGSPKDTCDGWARVTRHPFVLCPRGVSAEGRAGRFVLRGADETKRELRAALAALKREFGEHVGQRALLAGFGAGADQAISILLEEPSYFARVILVEPRETWSGGIATRFAQGGGRGVLWVCASKSCRDAARRAVAVTRGRGLLARVLTVRDIGRDVDAALAGTVQGVLPWLVEEDPWWASRDPVPAVPGSSAK